MGAPEVAATRRSKRLPGRVVAGLAVAGATVGALVGIAMLMFQALPAGATIGESAPPGWYQAGGLALVFLLLPGGLWCAWRVASGRWSFAPRPAAAAESPGATPETGSDGGG